MDDSYIHLSIAKNFTQKGVWGITSHEFTSTTSSPIFTLLLSFFIFIFGNYEYIPIILNFTGALCLLYVIKKNFKNQSYMSFLLALFFVIVLMPIHTMILTGMEHILHALSLLLFFLFLQKCNQSKRKINFTLLCFTGFISTGLRYESLFFILFTCFYIFFLKKQYYKAIVLGLISLSPVIIYGIISLENDSFFLPNSLILKGNDSKDIYTFIKRFFGNGYRALSIIPLVIILIHQLYTTYIKNNCIDKNNFFFKQNYIPLIILSGFCLHLIFANFGWLMRYEAYMIPLFITHIKSTLDRISSLKYSKKKDYLFILTVYCLLLFSFYKRFINVINNEITASQNIYDQQIQMAKFLHKYYNNANIIANDIGAITYFSDIKLLDIYGLGSKEIVKIRKKYPKKFSENNQELTNFVKEYSLKNHFNIAIIYDNWINLPEDFIKVAHWKFDNSYISDEKITFYAKKGKAYNELRKNILSYTENLPNSVEVILLNKD